MPRKAHLSRRQLLLGTGAAAALAPFLPLLDRDARAGTPSFPTRLVLFITANGMHGVYPQRWRPTGGGSSFAFPADSVLTPLAPWQDKLLVLQGIDNRGQRDTGLPGGHPTGLGTLLTGGALVEGAGMPGGGARTWTAQPVGPSIDQYIASAVGGGAITAGVGVGGPESFKTRFSFKAPDQPVPPDNDPAAVWQRIFEPLTLGSEELERLRTRRLSVLDVVGDEVAELRDALGSDERFKMDAHLAGIRAAEQRIEQVGADCTPPGEPGIVNFMKVEKVPAVTDAHLRQIQAAFSCGVARVATIMFGSAPHNWSFPWLPAPLSAGQHELSHRGSSDTSAQDELVLAQRWYAGRFEFLLELLDAVPEGDGTMLDNTVVVWLTDNARSNNHSWQNMPIVIGGGGGYFPTGRFETFSQVPHNRLLVSLTQSMGIATDTFGDPGYGSGALDFG